MCKAKVVTKTCIHLPPHITKCIIVCTCVVNALAIAVFLEVKQYDCNINVCHDDPDWWFQLVQ